ncbi:MAG: hypothetical protein K8F92_16385, partial [Hyphomicrobium sp.]|uniref:hypothetical protein n=1 Tax=Hyphomicrobium sp. TaxID=82 RepID=UPI0025B9EC37
SALPPPRAPALMAPTSPSGRRHLVFEFAGLQAAALDRKIKSTVIVFLRPPKADAMSQISTLRYRAQQVPILSCCSFTGVGRPVQACLHVHWA